MRPAKRFALLAAVGWLVASCASSSAAPRETSAGIDYTVTPAPSGLVSLNPGESPSHRPRHTESPAPASSAQIVQVSGGGDPTIVAAGDIACDPTDTAKAPKGCDQLATAELAARLKPTAVLTLGDTQYEKNAPGQWGPFDSSWGKLKALIHPTIGNHEYLTHDAVGYFGYFGAAAGDPSRGYYSWDLGAWHLISLNSECSHIGGCSSGSPEVTWLLQDLQSHSNQCVLAYWHEPRWSSGEHGDATQMDTIWRDLVGAHVAIVLSGHNHDYERFQPLDGNGQPASGGVMEFVVGTGGKNHYGFTGGPLTGEVVRDESSFGVLQLALHPSSFQWSFVPAPSYSFTDSGSASCPSR